VVAYRLLGVRLDAPAFARRFDAPFVGRDDELAQLQQAYARAVRDRSCHLFTLLGPAGIGKSRLTQEFLAEHNEAAVLRGHCLPYGEGITYFPLVETLEGLAGDERLTGLLQEDDEARGLLNTVSAAIGLTEAPALSREDTFHAVRKLLERLARERPLVLVLDDLHWAEPTFLDLVDHIADWSREAPIFLLCPARPDLLDARPAWAGGKLNATTMLLEPLSEQESETLIENLLVGTSIAASLRERISETAEGNPLFVEQMLALIAQNGHEGEIPVPPTIQALLATRLEQLPATERVAAERGSVIGKEFWRSALSEIGGDVAGLPGLVRKELIRPHVSPVFPQDDAFRFRHQLIRDAAYDSMPKELRSELHERFGRWLEANRSEYDEIVGYHFEQAYRLREELGRLDQSSQALAIRAGRLLGRAGQRAFQRGDSPAAVSLLGRATDLLPDSEGSRAALFIEFAYALHETGDLERAGAVFDRAETATAEAIAARARVGRIYVDTLAGGGFLDLLDRIERELATLEGLGDELGLAEGWYVAALLLNWMGRSEESRAAYGRTTVHAARAGNHRLETLPATVRLLMEAYGAVSVADGLKLCKELLAAHGGTSLEPYVRSAHAIYISLDGAHDEATREIERAHDLFREYGNELIAAASRLVYAQNEIRAGRLELAEQRAREGAERLESFGEKGFYSTTLGLLAEAVCLQGRYDEAEEYAEATAAAAIEHDLEPASRWRSVRARVHAHRGELEEAERLAREAVEILAATDWLAEHGDALVVLADVLELAGRTAEVLQLLEEALALYERKGVRLRSEELRLRLAQIRK
jgi:tetratricopeptide (TPR) repeat protein